MGCSPKDLKEIDFSQIFSENISSIQLLSGGHSGAKVYKISAAEKWYVLRHCQAVEKLSREFLLTEKMGRESISPSVHYSNAAKGIIVMDYIPKRAGGSFSPDSFKSIPEGSREFVRLIKQLHKYQMADLVIKEEGEIPRVIDDVYKELDHNILNKEELLLLKRVVESPWPQREKTFVHNDLYSENILHDGSRFWIIDWELAGLGDPFYDLAYFVNFQDMSKSEGLEILNIYLDKNASQSDVQEFHLMRRLAYGYNAIFRLAQASKAGVDSKIPVEGEIELKTPLDLFRAIDMGTVDFSNGRDLYRAGLIFLNASAHY